MTRIGLVIAPMIAVAASAATAATTTYGDLTSWSAVAGLSTLEDFNDVTQDDFAPFDAGDFSLTAVGDFASDNGIEAYDPNPNDVQTSGGQDRNIDGTTYYSGDVQGTVVTFLFDFAISAISWEQTSIGDTVINFGGDSVALGSDGFFGLTSDVSVTSFTLTGTDGAFGIDNIRYSAAAPVPVPGALPLLGIGLAGVAAMRRRQRT